jgi:hypothetical protein
MICPTGRTKYFLLEGWTVKSALIALGKFDFWRGFCQCGVIGSRHREVRPTRQPCNDGFESAILRLAQLPEPPVEINALITDIANANSTVGFYLVPPGEEKEC